MRHLLLSLALLVAACGGMEMDHAALNATSGMCEMGLFHVNYACEGGAAKRGTNSLQVQLSSPEGVAITGAALTVTPFMPAHGHGSGTKPKVTELGAGAYRADDLVLTMPGEWNVTIAVTEGARHDDIVFALDVP